MAREQATVDFKAQWLLPASVLTTLFSHVGKVCHEAASNFVNACFRVDFATAVFCCVEDQRYRQAPPAPISKKDSYLPTNNQKCAEDSRYISNQGRRSCKSDETK
jgi:hypothetical protein